MASDTVTPAASAEPANRNIKNVVFDMGGVLMTFNGLSLARHYTETEEDALLLHQAYFGRNEWALLDAGVIAVPTMERIAQAHLPERLHPNLAACAADWQRYSVPIPQTEKLVKDLKAQGYGLYLLSNASREIDKQLDHCPAYQLMDGRVVSGFERLMKPDPAIFTLLCERYDLDPASCLFVDDNADNCRGAEAAGMRAFHFTGDADALRVHIEALG